jgi:hypothetical protein
MCVSLVARTFSAPLAAFSTTKPIATRSRFVAIDNARIAQHNARRDRSAPHLRFLVEEHARSRLAKSSSSAKKKYPRGYADPFVAHLFLAAPPRAHRFLARGLATPHQALRAHRADVRAAPTPRRRALRSEK